MVNTRRSSFSVPSLPPTNSRRRSQAFERQKNIDEDETAPLLLPPRAPKSKSKTQSSVSVSVTLNKNSAESPLASAGRATEKSPTIVDNREEIKTYVTGFGPDSQISSLPPKPPKSTKPIVSNKCSSIDETQQTMTTGAEESSSTHFLHDINLEKCSDLLTIPDPPSPGQARIPGTKQHRRRRQSSPFLHSPLCDVTNQSGSTPTPMSLKDSVCSSLADKKAVKKRHRKSLCHVPVPPVENTSNSGENKTGPGEQEEKAIQDIPMERGNGGLVLCEDDELENDNAATIPNSSKPQEDTREEVVDRPSRSTRKSRKKRQSILLPSDIETTDTATTNRPKKRQSLMLPSTTGEEPMDEDKDSKEFFQHLKSWSSSKTKPPASSNGSPSSIMVKPSNSGTSESDKLKTDMAQIRKMVRQYCALPTYEKNASKYPEEIERICGYSLITPFEREKPCDAKGSQSTKKEGKSDLNWSCSPAKSSANQSVPSILKSKREIIMKLGSVVEVIDSKKAIETKRLEDSTGCRVVKSTRSGKYRYFDIVTNRKVNPSDYKALYHVYVEKCQQEKRNKVKQWIKDSKLDEVEATESKEKNTSCSIDLPEDASDSNHRCQEEREKVESAIMKESCSTEAVAEEYSLPVVEMSCTDSDRRKESEETDEDDMETGVTSAKSNSENESIESCQTTACDCSGEESLLPLPSRDDESNDPEIAAAEQKLWSAIDTALATYSKEIIEIEARRGGKVIAAK